MGVSELSDAGFEGINLVLLRTLWLAGRAQIALGLPEGIDEAVAEDSLLSSLLQLVSAEHGGELEGRDQLEAFSRLFMNRMRLDSAALAARRRLHLMLTEGATIGETVPVSVGRQATQLLSSAGLAEVVSLIERMGLIGGASSAGSGEG